jgi:hypothetical protein
MKIKQSYFIGDQIPWHINSIYDEVDNGDLLNQNYIEL